MMNSVSKAIEYLDKRLATIDTAPGTWASSEALELQALLLLEVRTFLLRPKKHAQNPFEVRSSYIRFIRSVIRKATAESMAVQLERQGRINELPGLLGQFRDQVVKQFVAEEPLTTSSIPKPMDLPTKKIPSRSWQSDAFGAAKAMRTPPRMGGAPAGVDA